MPVEKSITHIFEPNPLACGQAAVAMLSGIDVYKIILLSHTEKELKLSDIKYLFEKLDINYVEKKNQAYKKDDLPNVALLSLETPKCWHWSIYFHGKFYDPVYGILDNFPLCNRKFFWEICED